MTSRPPAAVDLETRPPWLPFTTVEYIDAMSFTWRARVGIGPLTLLLVTDRYAGFVRPAP